MPALPSTPSPRFSILNSTGATICSIIPRWEISCDAYLRGYRPRNVRDDVAAITRAFAKGAFLTDTLFPSARWPLARRGTRGYFRRFTPYSPDLPGHQLAATLDTTDEPVPVNLLRRFANRDGESGSAASYYDSARSRPVSIRSLQTLLRAFGHLNGLDDLLKVGSLPSAATMRSSLSRFEFAPGVRGDEWSRVQPSETHASILRRKLTGRRAGWKGGAPYGILIGVASYLRSSHNCRICFEGEYGAVIDLPRPPTMSGPWTTVGPWYAICLLAWNETSKTVVCVKSYLEPIVASNWPLLVESNQERHLLEYFRQWLFSAPFGGQIHIARKPALIFGNAPRWDVELGTHTLVVCIELLGAANQSYLAGKRVAKDSDGRKVVFIEGYRSHSPGKLNDMYAAALDQVVSILTAQR